MYNVQVCGGEIHLKLKKKYIYIYKSIKQKRNNFTN